MVFHVGTNLISTLPVKATEKDGPHRDGHIISQPSQEASTFKGNVRRPHAQGLPRGCFERKDIIGCDGKLRTRAGERRGTSSNRNNEATRSDCGSASLLVKGFEGVRVLKLPQLVQVSDTFLTEVDTVLKVQSLDMILDILPHGLPVVGRVHSSRRGAAIRPSSSHRNSKDPRIHFHRLIDEGRSVHELLGDAPHVDARPPQSPGRARGGWLHEVHDRHLGPQGRRLLRRSQAARSSPNDYEVILVPVTLGVPVLDELALVGCVRCVLRGAELPAPGDRVVVTADEGLDPRRIGFGRRGFGGPAEGGGRMPVRAGIGDLVPEAAVDEPRAVVGAGGEFVIDNLDLGGEEDGEGGEDGGCAAVEGACTPSCNVQDLLRRHCEGGFRDPAV
mmetsp:Transcript_21777/g.44079  ORF Transcript_21777/g.44079 Transcript_21777/m.44079 type:complete len:389 (+) Transcript_21777:1198-2364(+)